MSLTIRLGVLIAVTASGPAFSADHADQHRNPDHTCTIIRPEGDRGAVVPDTWPGGIVPYEFESDVSNTNRNRVRNSMDMLEAVSGVTFIPRTNESARLNTGGFGGDWASGGRTGGQQNLSIYTWSSPLIICHDLIHALGRYHQQSRTDRDDYIQVNWENIDDDYEYNYYISNSDEFGPYDFESVMHYSQWGFSTGGPTMTCLPGYEQWQNVMGQREYLSDGDIATLQYMYVDGVSDASVLFVQASPDELEAGADTHVLAVLKNLGDQAAFDADASIYLSADATLGSDDVLLHQESYAYLLPGELVYLSVDVTIPAGTADGTWYVGVKLDGAGDSDGSNNAYVTTIDIGALEDCPADISGNGSVDVDDVLAVVAAFGDCGSCSEDIDGDGTVGVDDLLVVIAAFGPC
jgi:hypothetical protein